MCGVCFLLKQRLRRRHLLELLARQKENTKNAHDIKNGDNSANVNSAEEKKDINQNSSRHDDCNNTTHNTNKHVHAKYSSCDSMPSGSHCDVFHIELCNSTEDMHITSLTNSECNKRILLQESTSCTARLLDYTCTTMGNKHVCEVNQHAQCNNDGHHLHKKEEEQCEMNERSSSSSSSSLFERLVCNVLHRGPDVQKVLKRCVECRGTINMNCITTTTNNNSNTENANNEKDDSDEPMYLLTNNTVETLHHGITSNDHSSKQHDDSSVAASVETTSMGANNTNGMGEQYDCQNYSVDGVFVHTEMQAVSSVLGLRGTVPITQPYEVEETSDRRSLQTRQCSRHNISSPVGSRPFNTSTTINNTTAAAAATSSSSPHHTHSCGSHGKTKPEDVKSDSVLLLQEQWFDEPYELYEKEIGHGAIRSSSHKSFLMWNGEIFDGAMCPPPWGSDTVILARQLCDLESKCVHLYGEEEEQKQEHHYSSTSSPNKANKINTTSHNSGSGGIKEGGEENKEQQHNGKGVTSKDNNTVKSDANKTNTNGDDNTWFFHFKNDTDNLMFNDFNSDEDNDNNSEGNGEAGYYYNHSTHYGNKYARHLLPLRTRQEKFLSSCVELLENNVEGPYGFVFYAARLHMAVFGRDPLGRHSLLVHASTSLSQESLLSSSSSSGGKGHNIKNCNRSSDHTIPTSEPGEHESHTTNNKQEEEEDDDDDDYIDVEFIVSSVGVQHALRSNAESSVFVDGAANKDYNNDNNSNANTNVDYVHEPVSLPSHLGSNSEVNTKMISGNKRVRSNEMCEEHVHSTCATTSVANSLKPKRANSKCKKDHCNDHDEDDEDYNITSRTGDGNVGVECGSKHVSDHGTHTVCWVELPVSGIFALPVQEPLITSLLSSVTKNEKDHCKEETNTNVENNNNKALSWMLHAPWHDKQYRIHPLLRAAVEYEEATKKENMNVTSRVNNNNNDNRTVTPFSIQMASQIAQYSLNHSIYGKSCPMYNTDNYKYHNHHANINNSYYYNSNKIIAHSSNAMPPPQLPKCLMKHIPVHVLKHNANHDDELIWTQRVAVQYLYALSAAVFRRIDVTRSGADDNTDALKLFKAQRRPLCILFSGGLDCTVLAALAHYLLPLETPIELVNVAFGAQPEQAPDRIAALHAVEELLKLPQVFEDRISSSNSSIKKNNGSKPHDGANTIDSCREREWRLVLVDVHDKLSSNTQHILDLITPRYTVMDFDIGSALWYAAHGEGRMQILHASDLVVEKMTEVKTRHEDHLHESNHVINDNTTNTKNNTMITPPNNVCQPTQNTEAHPLSSVNTYNNSNNNNNTEKNMNVAPSNYNLHVALNQPEEYAQSSVVAPMSYQLPSIAEYSKHFRIHPSMTDPKASQLRTGNVYLDNTGNFHCVNNLNSACANSNSANNINYKNANYLCSNNNINNNNNQLGYDTYVQSTPPAPEQHFTSSLPTSSYVPPYMCNSASTIAKMANNTYTPMPCGPNPVHPIPFMPSTISSTALSSSSSATTTTTTMAAAPIPFVPCAMSYAVPTPQPMPTVIPNNTINNNNNSSICSTNSCTNTNSSNNTNNNQGIVHGEHDHHKFDLLIDILVKEGRQNGGPEIPVLLSTLGKEYGAYLQPHLAALHYKKLGNYLNDASKAQIITFVPNAPSKAIILVRPEDKAQARAEPLPQWFCTRHIYEQMQKYKERLSLRAEEHHDKSTIHPPDAHINSTNNNTCDGTQSNNTTNTTVADKEIDHALMSFTPAPGTFELHYRTSSKVMLLGMGADETLGGYTRYRRFFHRHGMRGAREELEKDFARLWQRNLGRDDRITADSGHEPRFPYLDEGVLRTLEVLVAERRAYLLHKAEEVNAQCEFTPELNDEITRQSMAAVMNFDLGPGDGDKRVLRNVARMLGLNLVTRLQKRAIQFGSRVAERKIRGTTSL